MRLSEKQALVMFAITQEASKVSGGMAGYSHEQIEGLVNDIINQQSDDLRELDK